MSETGSATVATHESASRARGRRLAVAGVVAALLLVGAGGAYWHFSRVPKRFAAVVEGELYRSGELTPRQLEYVVETYGIRDVVCLLNDQAPQTLAEEAAARKLGVRWHNIPLTGDGASTPEQRERIKSILLADHDGPLLVHCAAGVNRTGLGVGLYRIHKQGWSYEQVLREMLEFDFDNEPKHENLREALRQEADTAPRHGPATQPAP